MGEMLQTLKSEFGNILLSGAQNPRKIQLLIRSQANWNSTCPKETAILVLDSGPKKPHFWNRWHSCRAGILQAEIIGLINYSVTQTKHFLVGAAAGLPDYFQVNMPKQEKTFQITTKYTNWP
jgi:hypothetical protein